MPRLTSCCAHVNQRLDLECDVKVTALQVPKSTHNYYLEFMFDAATDCTLSIWYLCDEIIGASNNTVRFETDYRIQPKTVQFPKGLGHHYVQPIEEGMLVYPPTSTL